jgi:RNA polymerase sigma factor (sigma-70 family)
VSEVSVIDRAELEVGRSVFWRERLEGLFDTHNRRLYQLARRLTRDPEEARDLVQEAFLRVARRPKAIPHDAVGAESWLVRVMINLCRDRERRLAVRRRNPLDAPSAECGPDPERSAVARATVQAALARLSPRRRAVIVLHELEELPVRQVAKTLGLAQVTVRWHLAAARKDLARMLEQARPRDKEPSHGQKD